LLNFLKNHRTRYLYLVGDIFDFWCAGKRRYWPEINNEIINWVLNAARNGTRVYYIPGNHDSDLNKYEGRVIRGVHICRDVIHETADGRKFLITHGDEFDSVTRHSPFVAQLGSIAYNLLLHSNRYVNICRKKVGLGYWSLSNFLKQKTKKIVKVISRYEGLVLQAAKQRDVDGLICGHIHQANLSSIDGILYRNTGDWVESCTALTEDENGSLQIARWTEDHQVLFDECKSITEKDHTYAHCNNNRCLVPTS
jgi:UDP-2,3-diacylglucosamine pyrophosphatase LpxH